MIKRVIETCLFLVILMLVAAAASATVHVNEFLANGPSPEPDSEWIELYNDASTQVYLTGWNISDGEGYFVLPASVIPANGFVVLTNNQTVFNSFYSTTATVIEYGPGSTGNFNLANSNDNIILHDSVGTLISQITYGSAQTENVSYGRNYDGSTSGTTFTTPTPGTYNNRRPVFSTVPNQTFAEDNNLTINFANYVTDPDSDPMNLTVSSISNIAVYINGMNVTFVPDADWSGTRVFAVNANDGLASTIQTNIYLNVTAVNDAPRLNIPTVVFNEEGTTTLSLDTYTVDPDTTLSQITWTRVGGDSNIGTSINPTTHVVTFNATQNFCGQTAVILRARDTNTSYTDATVNVNVTCIQDSPVLTLISPNNTANIAASSVNLQWTGSDVDNDLLTYEVFTGNLASNLTSQTNTTATTYPLTGLTNGQTVYWRIVARDNNTPAVNSAIYSFNVLMNNAPVISSYTPTTSPITIVKNNSQAFNVTVTDADNDTLTYAWTLNGTTLTSTANSLILDSTNYAPGHYILNCTATDPYPSSVSRTWTVDIRYRNAPSFNGPIPPITLNENSNYNLNLNTYFNDSDNDLLTYTATSANNLMVTITNGIATITPSQNFFGARGLKFTASDGLNQTESNIVTVIVNKNNDAPDITSFTPTLTSLKTADNVQTDFEATASDDDNDPITFKWYVDNELMQETVSSKYNLREYPIHFSSYGYFNGQVVVGSQANQKEVLAANKITQGLNEVGLTANSIHTVDQIRSNNLILIGTPCSNSKVAELLGTDDCNYFASGEAMIKAYEYNNFMALVVTGHSDDDVLDAATVLGDFDSYTLTGDEVRISTSGSITLTTSSSTATDQFSFTTGDGGTYTIKLEAYDVSNAKDTQTWTLEVLDKPVASTFNGETTDFENVDLSDVHLVLEKTSYGKIEFDNSLDLNDVVDLDSYVTLSQGLVAIDSANLPELNQPATITLYGITETNPFIYYTNEFTTNPAETRLCTHCQIIEHTGTTLKFHVDHFSTFVVKEATGPDVVLPESIQIGEDNEVREQNITTSFTITNPGTNETIQGVVIASSATSKYNLQFSTGTTYTDQITIDLQPGETQTINLKATIPKREDGGLHSIGKITAASADYSDTAVLYMYPEIFLEVVSVKIDGDTVDDGDSTDIQPDKDLDVVVEVENIGTEDFDDVEIIATVYDLDDGDDVDEEVDFKLKQGKKTKKTLTFNVPDDLDEDDYELEIEIEAIDDDNVKHSQTLSYTLETQKEKHQLKLETSLSTETAECLRKPILYARIKNLGEEDEDDVRLEIRSPSLGLEITNDEIEIYEDDDYFRSFDLNLENTEAGTYPITVSAYRGSRLSEETTLNVEVKDCQQTAELTQQQKASIQQKHQDLITKALAEKSEPVVVKTKTTPTSLGRELAWLFLIITGLLTVGVLIFAVGALIIKSKR